MRLRFLVASCFAALICLSASGNDDDIRKGFANPPKEARPYVWWHWMDGNVTKDGILRDLSWMDRSGIAGFHQFDAGGIKMPQAMDHKHVYFSESWKEMLRYALHVADSLGMDATIASAPGWSSTGGKWVTPQDAMKKLEWKWVVVKGGKVDVQMPSLYCCVGSYQDCVTTNDRVEVKPFGYDVSVVAVKIPEEDLEMHEICSDVNVTDSVITCSLKKATTVKALTLHSDRTSGRPFKGEAPCFNFLEKSDDGRIWTRVCGICPSELPYITVNIPVTKARYFRVVGERLVGLELNTVHKIEHAQEQAGFSTPKDLHRYTTPSTSTPIREIIDLTGKMSADGHLSCSLPHGRWRIYRFGASLTGKVNHPASPEATGLEVDKLDPAAWLSYFHTYVDMYKEAAGGNLGQKGIARLLIDSYEAGIQTWTPRMGEQFRNRRGYELTRWLPVIAGEIVESSEKSEKFLWDWRKTIGELYAENYDRVNDIIKEYGMKGRYTESHEGGRAFVGDGMDVKRNAEIPMSAIWMNDTPEGSRIPAAISDIRESASVAHLYGKPIVAAESFTVEGSHQKAYTYVPENMKYTADIAISAGLNRFVIHESPAQPNDSYLPGLQLFRYGQWFHRNETWADYAYVWTDYLARSCYMLQQGNAVSDVLVYYGEDTNATAQYGGVTSETLFQIPDGYNYDYANPYAILHTLRPEGSKLVTDSGMKYGVLVLSPDCVTVSVEILERIKAFADAGVAICGVEPKRCAGMNGDEKRFKELVHSIWETGRANVVSTLDEALKVSEVAPDLIADKGISYVHRTDGQRDIYWVRNFTGKPDDFNLSFRSSHRAASLFNPETGRCETVDCSAEGERSDIRLHLSETSAMFVVLGDSNEGIPAPAPELELAFSKPVKGTWSVDFNQLGGGMAHEEYNTLRSWTESGNPIVKYYAGKGDYNICINISKSELDSSDELTLALGTVKNVAEVRINGSLAGVLWKAPFETEDIKALLREGENSIEIKVANVWVNRMIGDCQPGETHPVTQVRRFYNAKDPILPSGLIGPVSLNGYTRK